MLKVGQTWANQEESCLWDFLPFSVKTLDIYLKPVISVLMWQKMCTEIHNALHMTLYYSSIISHCTQWSEIFVNYVTNIYISQNLRTYRTSWSTKDMNKFCVHMYILPSIFSINIHLQAKTNTPNFQYNKLHLWVNLVIGLYVWSLYKTWQQLFN